MDFVIEAIKQNTHWQSNEIDFPRVRARLVKREIFPELLESVEKKFVSILKGLRRTGKSVLAREIMAHYFRQSPSSPKKFAWFEFDRAMNAKPEDLDSLIQFFSTQGSTLIVLDEVQFVPMWQDVVKRHYDRTEIKFVATGSSAIELDKRSAESLAGRFDTILVKPFSFTEKLLQKEIKYNGTREEDAVNSELMQAECEEYLKNGGLPEISNEPQAENRVKYVKETLLDQLFYKDLPAIFPEANSNLLHKTLELLTATAGSTYQHQNLAQAMGVSHTTTGIQVELLEKALLAKTIYNKTPSLFKQKRTSKKIVFADNAIITALNPDTALGKLAENAAAAHANANLFYRDEAKHEVDFLIPEQKLAVEIKYQGHINTSDERALRYFLEKFKQENWRGLLVTKNEFGKNAGIQHIPLWKFLATPAKQLAQLLA